MENDESKTTGCKNQPVEQRQNRRQFFNGFGKWSLAIIAAVSALGDSGAGVQASREDASRPEPEPQRPAWAVGDDHDPRQRMASYFRRRDPNYKVGYAKLHGDHTRHYDGGSKIQ